MSDAIEKEEGWVQGCYDAEFGPHQRFNNPDVSAYAYAYCMAYRWKKIQIEAGWA